MFNKKDQVKVCKLQKGASEQYAPKHGRFQHCSVLFNNKTMLVIGGADLCFQGAQMNEIFEFDIQRQEWQPPSTAIQHAASTSSTDMNDEEEASSPHLFGHTACMYGDRLYIFGGFSNYNYSNIVFEYCASSKQWIKTQSKHENAPTQRMFHTTVVYKHYLVIFGGEDDNGPCNDMYMFNLLGID